MLWNYLPVLRDLMQNRKLATFVREHDRLYQEARRKDDYAEVATHYYDLMGPVIERAWGSSWIFCPPEYPGQPREEAIAGLHHRISRLLGHGPGKVMLDMGCGLGGAARETASYAGGKVVGVTLSKEEVDRANALNAVKGLSALCEVRQGNYAEALPFESDSLDSAYSIYSLKYIPVRQLGMAFKQAHRVMKPGARYAVYDAVLTDEYDANNGTHRDTVERLVYRTGMPPLHTRDDLVQAAAASGLTLATEQDLSGDLDWTYFLARDRALNYLARASFVRPTLEMLERLRVAPQAFAAFNATFLSGTRNALVDAGRLGIVSFSRLFVFEKAAEITRAAAARRAAAR